MVITNHGKIIFIVGPTAVGKSDVGMHLARKLRGEIVSCDSMQIYKEIRIASNKPSPKDLNEVPHYLVDIISVREEFDVAKFNTLALAAIHDIHRRGRVPVIVGGSGMYMQVLLDGIFEGGIKNQSLRKDLKGQAHQYGNQYLYDKLKEEDAQAAAKIHPNDVRRVIRALEVCITRKTLISQLQTQRQGLYGQCDIALFAFNREREALYAKINARVDRMIDAGLVDEISRLNGCAWSLTARKIIGVAEIQSFLNGDCDLQQAKEQIKLNTRRLAKRQLTWFRRDDRLQWIMLQPDDTPETVTETIMELWCGQQEAERR